MFKRGDKVMIIDWLKFKLPDGFQGGLPDALRELATYLDSPTDRRSKDIGEVDTSWEYFVDLVNNKGVNAIGLAQVSLWNEQGNWERIPLGITYKESEVK